MTGGTLNFVEDRGKHCVLLLIAVVAMGTAGFLWTESDWTVWKSLYFTLVTITTVGYGDEGISDAEEIVASVLLIGGIGSFTYAISTLVQLAMDRDAVRTRKMIEQVKTWEGHVVVCGYGRMGESICRQLMQSNRQCVVVEEDQVRYQAAIGNGLVAIEGVASEDETLSLAGIERADAIVAAVNSDADNMYIIVSARALNSECAVIARAETQSAGRKMEHAGATFVVLPHMMAGESAATAILNPRLTQAMRANDSSSGRLVLGEAVVHDASELISKTVKSLGEDFGNLVFVALETADGQLIMRPPGERTFDAGDVLICAGNQRDIELVSQVASESVLAV